MPRLNPLLHWPWPMQIVLQNLLRNAWKFTGRREAAEMFRKGDRPELAEKEEAELKLVESYMPAAPSAAEIGS